MLTEEQKREWRVASILRTASREERMDSIHAWATHRMGEFTGVLLSVRRESDRAAGGKYYVKSDQPAHTIDNWEMEIMGWLERRKIDHAIIERANGGRFGCFIDQGGDGGTIHFGGSLDAWKTTKWNVAVDGQCGMY